jgi:energy-coupling factor transporter ATP-binding protein EcfA2
MKLKSVRVQRFKKVSDAGFNVGDVNVLVGGNNSGKSTIVQALHFGVALLQTIQASGFKWPKTGPYPTSLNPSDIIYSPSEDVYALGTGASLKAQKDQGPQIDYTLESGETCSVTFFKGKNRNIAVIVSNAPVAQKLAQLDRPFSVFSPGLAGISKREAYVSDGVLFRSLARGDANLVLRNILLRLWPGEGAPTDKQQKWEDFLTELRQVFPNIDIVVEFDSTLDEYIKVLITTNEKDWVPLEIVGTGVLQATQILSYIHRFQPSLMVLDEPDSHLHPDNQRLLCALLRGVTAGREMQVILTTHSRHVIDAIGATSNVLWVREGGVDVANQDDEIGILMEIGALDIRERIGQQSTTTVVLTEDTDTSFVKAAIESSGFDPNHTVIQSYHGVTSLHSLRPLVSMIKSIKPEATIVVHRDRDLLNDGEVAAWKSAVIKLKAESFITRRIDIESHFIEPKYLASINPSVSVEQFTALISECLSETHDEMVANYVNGRTNIARQDRTVGALNPGALAVEAQKAISSHPDNFVSKYTLKAMRPKFKGTFNCSLQIGAPSPLLKCDELEQIAKKVKKPVKGPEQAQLPLSNK